MRIKVTPEDLTGFVNAPARQNAALFLIDECRQQRAGTEGIVRFERMLMVECEPSWVTAKPGAAREKNVNQVVTLLMCTRPKGNVNAPDWR